MIRKKYNIEKNALISVDQLEKIGMKDKGVKVHVFNQHEYLLSNDDNEEYKEEIFLLLKDEYYYHIETTNYKNYRKCETCNKTLRTNNLNHKCKWIMLNISMHK